MVEVARKYFFLNMQVALSALDTMTKIQDYQHVVLLKDISEEILEEFSIDLKLNSIRAIFERSATTNFGHHKYMVYKLVPQDMVHLYKTVEKANILLDVLTKHKTFLISEFTDTILKAEENETPF